MRLTLSALVVAAGLVGFGAAAQAAPVPPSQLGASAADSVVPVRLTHRERHMMRRHIRHERRVMRHIMRHDRRMMRRHMRHERRMMHRM